MATQKTISQRIALEGAEEILRQLGQMGKDGERAFQQLKTAVDAPTRGLTQLSTASNLARDGLGRLSNAAGQLGTALGPVGDRIASLAALLGSFRGGLAGGAAVAVGGLGALAKSTADSTVEFDRQARSLGLSIEQLQTLRKAAREAGIGSDELAASLNRFAGRVAGEAGQQFQTLIDLTKEVRTAFGGNIQFSDPKSFDQLRNAAKQVAEQIQSILKQIGDPVGNQPVDRIAQVLANLARANPELRKQLADLGQAAPLTTFERLDELVRKNEDSFRSLGISLIDSAGKQRQTFDVLLDFADKISKLPDGFQKAALASQFFGRSVGPELVTELSKGRENLQGIAEALRKAGIAFDEDAVKNAIAARKAFKDFEESSAALGRKIGTAVLPVFTKLFDILNDIRGVDISKSFGNAVDNLLNQANTATQPLKALFDALGIDFSSVVERMKSAAAGLGPALSDIWSTLRTDAAAAWQQIGTSAGQAIEFVKSLFTADFWTSAFESIRQAAAAAWDGVKTAADAAWQFIVNAAQQAPGFIRGALAGLVDIITAPFRAAAQIIEQVFQGIASVIQKILDLANQARSAAAAAGGGGGGGGGFASGGHVRGAGTGTSDSIWARLSNGEFVIRAAAVRHFGANFFAALNAMRMPRFNVGGLVDGVNRMMAVPRFAAGGLAAPAALASAGGGRNLGTLKLRLADGETVSVMTDDMVAAKLARFAGKSDVASGGRKPSGYRG